MKGDLPDAAADAIIEAMTSHTDMTTRLLSDPQTMSTFVGLLYDLLTKADVSSMIGSRSAQ